MKPHTKIYLESFGYTTADFIPCEVCGNRVIDVHHIDSRGMGGDPQKKKEVIENLMGLCRSCHEKYGDIIEKKEWLKKLHLNFISNYGIKK